MKELKKSSLTVIVFIFLIIFVFAGFKLGDLNTKDFGEITGAAVIACNSDSDCGTGYICEEPPYFCFYPCDSIRGNQDCVDHGYIDDDFLTLCLPLYEETREVCLGLCESDTDCPEGEECNEDSLCVEAEEETVSENCTNTIDDDADGFTDSDDFECIGLLPNCTSDAYCGPNFQCINFTEISAGYKCVYECSTDQNCVDYYGAGGKCVINAYLEYDFCNSTISMLCSSDNDCPSEDYCQQFNDDNGYCIKRMDEDCTNGLDDDEDGCIDSVDSNCGGVETSCKGDLVDNDCDGLVDCDDPDCASDSYCQGIPVANIYEPKHRSNVTVENDIFFNARGSFDPDGNISLYVWDFGEKDKPWGILEKVQEGIICKSVYSTLQCSYLDADIEGTINPDVLGNPCTCPNLENASIFIYPFTRYKSKTQTFYKSYKDKNICTSFGQPSTNKCTVTLIVYDDEYTNTEYSIDLYLIGESTDTCPSLVNASHSCNSSDINLAYHSGNINCCCDENFKPEDEAPEGLIGTFESKCIPEIEEEPIPKPKCSDYENKTGCEDNDCYWYDSDCHTIPEPEEEEPEEKCGDGYCSSSESAQNCIQDCHCGDGECQTSYGEDEYTCSRDCKKASSSSLYIIITILLIAVVIVFFYLYKEGYFEGLMQRKTSSSSKGKKHIESHTRKPEPGDTKSSIKKYITETRKKGFTYSQIKKKLMSQGWSEDEINEAFSTIH